MASKSKMEEQLPPPDNGPTGTTMTATTMQVPAPLPPEHVDHAAVFYNEVAMRKQSFELGLAAIDAEIEGKKLSREDRLAELKRKYDDEVAEIERNYGSDMSSLDKRRTMMVIGIAMSDAALGAWHSPEGQQDAEQQNDDADGDDNQQQR
jgi:hypothetical protein